MKRKMCSLIYNYFAFFSCFKMFIKCLFNFYNNSVR